MSATRKSPRYSEEFKRSVTALYRSGKTYLEIQKEYGVSSSSLSNWLRKYAPTPADDGGALTVQQARAMRRRNEELEEENLILKKAAAIPTPHSDRD